MMTRLFFMAFLFVAAPAFSQCKTSETDPKTKEKINCTDVKNMKQGKWKITVAPLRGEPGFKEEGFYTDDKKEGKWIRFNLVGDVLAIENYKWGYKDGINEYFTVEGPIRKESWKAIDPKSPYDTVAVYDLQNPDKITQRLMRAETFSVRQGTWEYYDASHGFIIKKEDYVMDELIDPLKQKKLDAAKAAANMDSTVIIANIDSAIVNKNKPAEVLLYEKKNSNKKKIKVRDGQTGIN